MGSLAWKEIIAFSLSLSVPLFENSLKILAFFAEKMMFDWVFAKIHQVLTVHVIFGLPVYQSSNTPI